MGSVAGGGVEGSSHEVWEKWVPEAGKDGVRNGVCEEAERAKDKAPASDLSK